MTHAVLYSYLAGWVMTSIGLALTSRRLQEPVQPQSPSLSFVVAAGIVWPLLVAGAVQMAIIAMVAEGARNSIREDAPQSIERELDELLDEWLDAAHSGAPCQTSR